MKNTKRKKSFFFYTFLLLNIIAVLALFVSYGASWVKPSVFWPIAFFGLAYPFIVLIHLLFIIYWIFRRRWTFLLSVIALGIGWNTLLNYVQYTSKNQSESTANQITVVSYNAHLFKPIKTNKYDKKSKHEMLDMLLSQKADVLCIQEFYSRKQGAYDIEDSLKQAGYRYSRKLIFEENDMEELSMAVFSKHPIIGFEHIPFYNEPHANSCMAIDIDMGTDTIRMYNVHLQSISFQPEDYQYLDQVKSEVNADVIGSKRIGYRLKAAFLLRGEQAEKVKEHMEDSPYPVIVCGDFNDTPNSYAFHVISNNLQNGFREKGQGIGNTYNGAFPNFQIDYILCDKDLEVLSYRIVKKKYSDHYPVVAKLALPK
jgi:endonuclease/exonuclease/phosphatase family metal-dependent hydrolase